MNQPPEALGWAAIDIQTAINHFFFDAHKLAVAGRAALWIVKRLAFRRAFLKFDAYYFGNNLTGFAHHYGIAKPYIKSFNLVFVMQSGAFHRGTGQLDRGQTGNRSDRSGATDIELHRLNNGLGFFWWIFISNSPARRMTGIAKQVPKFAIV
ncbi:MAG: hypothetical protein BWY75_03614 [bacterium ADurb.Bin425]|nr:MAG: hypothetical protein BWY75_03614 [bacterium ADurb.Bin425]